MKKSILSHMAMYQNVLAVVKDHQSSWNTIPGMVTVVDLEKNPSIKLNIHYVFYGSMWFILPHSTQ
jgi:hypothetical protein